MEGVNDVTAVGQGNDRQCKEKSAAAGTDCEYVEAKGEVIVLCRCLLKLKNGSHMSSRKVPEADSPVPRIITCIDFKRVYVSDSTIVLMVNELTTTKKGTYQR